MNKCGSGKNEENMCQYIKMIMSLDTEIVLKSKRKKERRRNGDKNIIRTICIGKMYKGRKQEIKNERMKHDAK